MQPPEMAGWNLALRFALEIVALVALGIAGYELGSGALRWVLAIGIPALAAVAWATFNVRDDPSRSGAAPVPVNGWIRLAVELLVLGGGAVAIWYAGQPALAVGYAALVVIQYATSLERVGWLVEQ